MDKDNISWKNSVQRLYFTVNILYKWMDRISYHSTIFHNEILFMTIFYYEILSSDNISYVILYKWQYFMEDTILCYTNGCQTVKNCFCSVLNIFVRLPITKKTDTNRRHTVSTPYMYRTDTGNLPDEHRIKRIYNVNISEEYRMKRTVNENVTCEHRIERIYNE